LLLHSSARWRDIMSKLRVWQLTEYSRILTLDGLQNPLDGIFNEPGAQIVKTLVNITGKDHEPDLPTDYLLASFGEVADEKHN
jgi:alpha-N-acetylglucosamine transferase